MSEMDTEHTVGDLRDVFRCPDCKFASPHGLCNHCREQRRIEAENATLTAAEARGHARGLAVSVDVARMAWLSCSCGADPEDCTAHHIHAALTARLKEAER